MNEFETTKVLAILKTAYPNFYKNDSEVDAAIKLWMIMFKEETAQLVEQAIYALLSTSKWVPAIADVKEKILLLTRPPDLTEQESWNLVMKAIKSANYYAQENFDKLPPILQRLVGSPNQLREWASMDVKSLEVASSNFKRSYTARVKQEREYQVLPSSNKQIINGLMGKFNMPVLAEGEGENERD